MKNLLPITALTAIILLSSCHSYVRSVSKQYHQGVFLYYFDSSKLTMRLSAIEFGDSIVTDTAIKVYRDGEVWDYWNCPENYIKIITTRP